MNRFWQVLCVIAGLAGVGLGLREILTILRMRASAVRTSGIVMGYDRRTSEGRRDVYAPVIRFKEEHGNDRELTGRVYGSTVGRKYLMGSTVEVMYMPHRPETARLASVGYNAQTLVIPFGVGFLFIAVALSFGPE